VCLYSLGEYSNALKTFLIADDVSPGSQKLNYLLGLGYFAVGDTLSGLKHYKKSIYCDPQYSDPYISLGYYHYNKNNLDSALYYYTILPDSFYADLMYYERGLAYLALKEKSKAYKDFQTYLEVGSNSSLKEEVRQILQAK